jgi:dolichol-phosphate mannosyltransferase
MPSVPLWVSVVIPTFNEAENIGELLTRLGSALGPARPDGAAAETVTPGTATPETAAPFEVLFVDDSTDDTPEVIEREAARRDFPVRLIHRATPENGLGGAVLEGLRSVTAPWAVVMDADLQHPPEAVPGLLAAGEQGDSDLVVATRYAGGGGAAGLADRYRVLVSRGSTTLSKALFRRRLAGISDPMSGFFAVRSGLLAGRDLHPSGYKILLELAVRCSPSRIAEVPYVFQPRFAGESKASLAEGLRFLRHLIQLRFSATRYRMLAFGLIGLSGVLPNLAALWLLTRHAGIHYLPAEILANQAALAWNFVLLDTVLFHHRRTRHWSGRFGKFALAANADLVLRIPLLAALVHYAHLGVLPATALTLVAAFALRFYITDRAIYVPRLPDQAVEPAADAG